jgi:SOS response regulatory protein OraA/RecX
MYTLEEFDEAKSKVLKYIIYKKRTKMEVKQKFSSVYDFNLLNDLIDELEQNGYIDDINYIKRSINEFEALNNLSIQEIKYKLLKKGIDIKDIEDYIYKHGEELEQYEINSAKNIIIKKRRVAEDIDIENFLYKKGYKRESIKEGFEEA